MVRFLKLHTAYPAMQTELRLLRTISAVYQNSKHKHNLLFLKVNGLIVLSWPCHMTNKPHLTVPQTERNVSFWHIESNFRCVILQNVINYHQNYFLPFMDYTQVEPSRIFKMQVGWTNNAELDVSPRFLLHPPPTNWFLSCRFPQAACERNDWILLLIKCCKFNPAIWGNAT
jgi:hypothetical protein